MEGWPVIALRAAAYGDGLLLAGLLLGGGLRLPGRLSPALIMALALAGALLAAGQFVATSLAMMGGDIAALDRAMVTFMLLETSMGISSLVRFLAFLLAAIAIWGAGGRRSAAVAALVALGSFAWSGHAGAGEGWAGYAHRISDIAHLVAAALWTGAMALLIHALGKWRPGAALGDIRIALQRFASVGSAIVLVLIVSGVTNLLMIVGFSDLPALVWSGYGWTLAVKLALFMLMLGLAARHRWRLVPQLDSSNDASSVGALRSGIGLEIVIAALVIVAVAVLGTLAPTP